MASHDWLLFFDEIEHFNNVSGALLNSLLLYLIHRFSRKDLGEYRILLTAFAGFDIFLCFLHWMISPKLISFGTTFCVVSNCAWQNRHITLIYASMFTVPFGIVNMNFLYRYWAIKNSPRILLFSKRNFNLVLFLYALSAYSFWHLVSWWGTSGEVDEPATAVAREHYRLKYNKTIADGWLLMEYWRDGNFNVRPGIILISVDTLEIVSFIVAATLSSLTFYHIHKAQSMSSASRSFQLKVLTALCAQAFVPFMFVYIPYFCVGTFTFFGWPVNCLTDACTMLTSCFPAWDAVVIICLMKDYREGLLKLLCHRKDDNSETTVWKTPSKANSIVPSLTVPTII